MTKTGDSLAAKRTSKVRTMTTVMEMLLGHDVVILKIKPRRRLEAAELGDVPYVEVLWIADPEGLRERIFIVFAVMMTGW